MMCEKREAQMLLPMLMLFDIRFEVCPLTDDLVKVAINPLDLDRVISVDTALSDGLRRVLKA